MNHAIRIHETGGPEKMVWEEVPLPSPKPGEALVRHKAVGLKDRLLDPARQHQAHIADHQLRRALRHGVRIMRHPALR